MNGNILFLHLSLILILRKHWHHCFLAEFSKDDPDFFKEASSYNQLSPHKVMSRSNLHFLYKYNLIISNDCGASKSVKCVCISIPSPQCNIKMPTVIVDDKIIIIQKKPQGLSRTVHTLATPLSDV